MANNDSFKKVVTVTVLLCLVCSIIVSSAAVLLKPLQIANKALDFKSNVLSVAGIEDADKSIEELYDERVTARVVDLEKGVFTDRFDAATFDATKLLKDNSLSTNLNSEDDVAKIGRRENFAVVYLIQDAQGKLEKVILPVRGKGLWSTMYGLMVLEPDLNTVAGFGFYQHGETPGLGGEVDNPAWKAQWAGKQVYSEEGQPIIRVIKGKVDTGSRDAQHQVDGISGATLTGNGVYHLVQFWMGDKGFKPFLINLQKGEA